MSFNGVRDFMKGMAEGSKIAGCAAAVYRKGQRLFCGYEGYADIESKTPIGEKSAFRLASMTKPITAAAILICRQNHLVDLNDRVCDYLPEFRDMYLARKTQGGYERGERAKRDITVLNLLSHSSGLGSGAAGDAQFNAVQPREGDCLASAVSRYGSVLLDFEPSSAQAYSPVLGLDVAARIVEIASGEPYGKFVRENIFIPLGMNSTSYDLNDFDKEDIVSSYESVDGILKGGKPLHNFGDFPAGYTGGGAGLLSTTDDYARFADMLRAALRGEERILTRESVIEMKKPRFGRETEGISEIFNWGLGVRTVEAQTALQPLSPGSFGWSGAYGTHFWVDPKEDVVAVYMHNSYTYGGAGAPHTLQFEREVMRALNC